MEDQIHCPKCGSTQITANKKGFSGGKAVAGVVLTGGIGLLAGTIGSKKIIITCLSCGNHFKPGEGSKPITSTNNFSYLKPEIDYVKRRKANKIIAMIFFPLFLLFSALFFATELFTLGTIFLVIGLFFLGMAFVKKTENS